MAQPLTRYLDGRRYTVAGLTDTRLKTLRQALYYIARRSGVKVMTRVYPGGRLEVQAQFDQAQR
jgi:hypothetical protein